MKPIGVTLQHTYLTKNTKRNIVRHLAKLSNILDPTFKQEAKPQAPSSSFLAFQIVSRSRYIVIQSSFTSFSPKIFRITDLEINSK